MIDAWNWVLSVISSVWTWLNSWNFHGVPFAGYIIGFVILGILIDRIFN